MVGRSVSRGGGLIVSSSFQHVPIPGIGRLNTHQPPAGRRYAPLVLYWRRESKFGLIARVEILFCRDC